MGWRPEHLAGIELLPERHAQARAVLPERVALHLGDACDAPIADASCDLVFQATVFSSLLDDAFQQRLAEAMWRWVKPGGAVLWYDFTVDNPNNRDVRGVPLQRVRALFPHGRIEAQRVTLAPPLARTACRVWPGLYPVLNAVPLLRTHVLVVGGQGRPLDAPSAHARLARLTSRLTGIAMGAQWKAKHKDLASTPRAVSSASSPRTS